MAENTNVYDDKITNEDLSNLSTKEEADKSNITASYDEAIKNVDNYITDRQAYIDEWKKTQTNIQNEQTDFTIQQINQQKDQARSDYLKEQSGAYKDWQKQINPYGANAEAMAAQGLHHSGVSESAQVAYYNTYQNRVATARESYSRAVQNYENLITQARLANSSALAEIAITALEKESELALNNVIYKNPLITEKAKAERDITNDYLDIYLRMLGVKQGQDEFEYKKAQDALDAKGSGGGGNSSGGGNPRGQISYKSAKKLDTLKKVHEKTTKSTKSQKTVDMNSVLSLGYGPISAKKLNQLIKEGKVKESTKNGKLVYKKAFNY
jgi:hypothetical protein